MEHPFLDFLGPALVPELSSDVAAGSPGHIQLVLVPVAALGAFPHQLAFSKLKFESQFQALSTGGAISYVEVPNMQNNIPAVLGIIRYIYDNILYAELNTKSDFCQECGFDGEIQIVTDESGKLVWECPKCGNRDENKLNVARRTCGYIGTQFWNQGRTQEIKERVLHL